MLCVAVIGEYLVCMILCQGSQNYVYVEFLFLLHMPCAKDYISSICTKLCEKNCRNQLQRWSVLV